MSRQKEIQLNRVQKQAFSRLTRKSSFKEGFKPRAYRVGVDEYVEYKDGEIPIRLKWFAKNMIWLPVEAAHADVRTA